MRRTLLITLSLLATLVLAPVGSAATRTVSIKRSSFSPATVNVVAGDTIRWRNDDSHNHQVVSTTGTFASPVLRPGRTYSFRFDVAGTYRYRDALVPSSVGTIKVAGAPPAVTLATSLPQITYGTRITLSGQINSKKAGENVQLSYFAYGQGSEIVLATVITGADGTFSFNASPEDPHDLSRHLEDRFEPPCSDGGRSLDLARPVERLRHTRVCGAEHGAEAGAAAAALELRTVGHDQARHARPEFARPFQGCASARQEPAADRDVREPGRRGLPRGVQPRDRLPPRALTQAGWDGFR